MDISKKEDDEDVGRDKKLFWETVSKVNGRMEDLQ